MPDKPDFNAIFAEMDALGIAPLPEEQKKEAITPDTRLRDSFKEISDFVEKNGREPQKGTNMKERELAARLAEFRENPTKAKAVMDIDPHNLLPHDVASLDDVMSSLPLPSFDEDIFDVSGLPVQRKKPDHIATRVECKDFDKYLPLFERCQEDLLQNKRHLVRVAGNKSPSGLGKGCFAVVRHVLCYIANESDEVTIQFHKKNKRLRVIFENGTESDILLLSLVRALYEDGYLISERDEDTIKDMVAGEDEPSMGFVYVLKSLSDNPEIQKIPNLFKIGVSSQELQKRLANAENEPTYLMAKVAPLIHYPCYGIDVHKLETILHHVFTDAQVQIDIVDKNGIICHPREWFSVPISVIQQAIDMVKDGSIVNYHYDVHRQRMVEK